MESEEQSEKRGQAIRDFSTLKNSTCKSALPDYEKLAGVGIAPIHGETAVRGAKSVLMNTTRKMQLIKK